MLNPLERRVLQDLGIVILENISGLSASTLLYGIFVALFALSTSTVLQRQTKARSTWIMFGMTVLSFLLATLYWAAYLAATIIYTGWGLVGNNTAPVDDAWLEVVSDAAFPADRITRCTVCILQIIGDMIVIWRAWVLCYERRLYMIGPLALLLGTCGTAFVLLNLINADCPRTRGIRFLRAIYIANGTLSAGTNAVSTLLIGLKFWTHRKVWNIGMRRFRSHAQAILLLIIESGSIYFVLQAANLALVPLEVGPDTPLDHFIGILREVYAQSTAMYPTIVLLLIDQARSFVDVQTNFIAMPPA